jgi:hypothetical protein
MMNENIEQSTLEKAQQLAKDVVVAYPLHEWENESEQEKVEAQIKAGLALDINNNNHHFTHAFFEALGKRLAEFLPHVTQYWSDENHPEERGSYIQMKRDGTFTMALSNTSYALSKLGNHDRQPDYFKAVFKAYFRELSQDNFKEFSDKIVQHYTHYSWPDENKQRGEIVTQLSDFYRKERISSNINDLRNQLSNNKQLDPFHLANKDSQTNLDNQNNPQLNPFKIH